MCSQALPLFGVGDESSQTGKIQFKFDPDQQHQKRAIESVTGLFDGFPRRTRAFELIDECIPNLGPDEILDEEIIAHNLKDVQGHNNLPVSAGMNVDEGFELPIDRRVSIWRYPSFTLEMETGTGKTYVYLRTMYELRRQFGFSKFIIVVPSVAIYEGVIKSVEMTRSHFRALYHNESFSLIKYDGNRLGQLRDFSHSQFMTVMVMTMASFNKSSNNIYKPTEKLSGEKLPYEYIQEVRPIFILDECQNYETDTAKQALRTLHPLFALKYSATAGKKDSDGIWQYDNLVYQLDPLEAFRQNLVKRIQVFGVTEGGNANVNAYFRIKEFQRGLTVKAEAVVNKRGRRELGNVTLKQNDDLARKTKNEAYDGFVVQNIDMRSKTIEFANGEMYVAKTDKEIAYDKKEIFKRQITETVLKHMEVQEELKDKDIKVLSLFFIDRVANYRGENAIIQDLFEEIFNRYKSGYTMFKDKDAARVHEGYFAQKKTKMGTEEIDTEGGKNKTERDAEKIAFELIMRKKEQLLSFDEDVSFIFAHSALKEGWDNPNVFQICTLAQRYSERRKRQEIGRGLRLCVDQAGNRVMDSRVNVLTVIANESYEDFVNGLQAEYQETGNALPPPPTDAVSQPSRRNENVYQNQAFVQFWNKLIQRTDYKIRIDTEKVVKNVINRFNKVIVTPPEIVVKKGAYSFIRYEVSAIEILTDKAKIKISKKDSEGDDDERIKTFRVGDDLGKKLNDKALDGFVVKDISAGQVTFSNEIKLTEHEVYSFDAQLPMDVSMSVQWERDRVFPVFDLVGRISRETLLTRKTIIKIFDGIQDENKKYIFKNPEGFSSSLTLAIKEVLADHVAENVEYFLDGELENYDLNKVFPPAEKHPQRQLVPGSEASLYDKVQYESEVEKRFVLHRLNPDKRVVCFFKFPDSFKVKLPKIIGNYVPDWGVVWRNDEEDYSIELVRETKGTMHEHLLQYENEKRKIWCAKKHFREQGIDYRHIDDTIIDWWRPERDDQLSLDLAVPTIEILPDVNEREKFVTCLPVYSLKAAATEFGKEEFVEELGWVKANISKRLSKNMFVAQVVGKSMEPTIPDQSYCVFRLEKGGSRNGLVVLVESRLVADPETNQKFTIKRYHSEKEYFDDGTWQHKKIVLSPDNRDFDKIVLENVNEDDFRVVAELVGIL